MSSRPAPAATAAAESLRHMAARSLGEARSWMSGVALTPEQRLDRCIEAQQRFIARIKSASGATAKVLGDLAWTQGVSCDIGSLGPSHAAAAKHGRRAVSLAVRMSSVGHRVVASRPVAPSATATPQPSEAVELPSVRPSGVEPMKIAVPADLALGSVPAHAANPADEVREEARKRKKSLLAQARALNESASAPQAEPVVAARGALAQGEEALTAAARALDSRAPEALERSSRELAVVEETLRALEEEIPAGPLPAETAGWISVSSLIQEGRFAEAAPLIGGAGPGPAALEAARQAAAALDRGDLESARAASERSRIAAPWSVDAHWLAASLAQASAGDASGARRAAEVWSTLAERFPNDPRGPTARERAEASRTLAYNLESPPIHQYAKERIVTYHPRKLNLPGPALASPNLFLDIGGAALGDHVDEYHFLRAVLFSTRLKFGFGTTAASLYRTPFLVHVAGAGVERANVAVFFPLEAAFSPLNIRLFRNNTISPQLFATISPWATLNTRSMALGEAHYNVQVVDYGLKVPFGALLGLKMGSLSIAAPAGSSQTASWSRVEETRQYMALELYFGGMFGVPRPL